MCKHWVHNAFFLPVFFFFFLVFCFSRFCVSLVPIHQLCDECTSKIAEKLLHIGAYQSIIAFGGKKKADLFFCVLERDVNRVVNDFWILSVFSHIALPMHLFIS